MASSSSALPIVVLLLVAATLVAVVVQRVRIPYTVGLVIVGISVPSDALGLDTPTALSPSIVLPLLLPPLLFEAAFALRWDHLAPVAVPIGILATAGVVLSAAVTGGLLVLVIHLPWSVAEGLEQSERAFNIVDPALRIDHLERLQQGGIDAAAALRGGQLEVRVWEEAYLRRRRFDQDAMLALIKEVLDSGKAQGFPLTRLVAQMEWALEELPGVDDLLEYEIRLNYLLPPYDDPVI